MAVYSETRAEYELKAGKITENDYKLIRKSASLGCNHGKDRITAACDTDLAREIIKEIDREQYYYEIYRDDR